MLLHFWRLRENFLRRSQAADMYFKILDKDVPPERLYFNIQQIIIAFL
jgi:hypothetical protein